MPKMLPVHDANYFELVRLKLLLGTSFPAQALNHLLKKYIPYILSQEAINQVLPSDADVKEYLKTGKEKPGRAKPKEEKPAEPLKPVDVIITQPVKERKKISLESLDIE